MVLGDDLGNGRSQRICIFSQGNPRVYMEVG
jgi:hypothetical protein